MQTSPPRIVVHMKLLRSAALAGAAKTGRIARVVTTLVMKLGVKIMVSFSRGD